MNLHLASVRALLATLRDRLPPRPAVDVAVCPPFVYLLAAGDALAGSALQLGAQNLWPESSGAFTGEISAEMLREVGCRFVILGHSERRHVIGPRDAVGRVCAEDDALVNRKVRAALGAGLTPILCMGETLAQRDGGQTTDVLTTQVRDGLAGLEAPQVAGMVVAYEPVWAIGTGRNATPQQAAEAHAHIRRRIAEAFGAPAAGSVRILYGGSVKAANVAELMASADVDGALVGGASLASDEFLAIISGCVRAKGLN